MNYGEFIRKIKKKINIRLNDGVNIKKLDETDITITFKCNLNCAMCHQRDIKCHKSTMNLELFKKIIKNLKKDGVTKVSLVGGEIFVLKDIWDYIIELEKMGLNYDLATNAYNLNDKDISLMKKLKKLEKISTSLDGTEEIHDKIRGIDGSYKKMSNNIKKLILEGFRVNVGCVVQKANFKEIENIFEHFCKMGVNDISFLYEMQINNDEKEASKRIIKKITGKESEIYASSQKNIFGELSEEEIAEIPSKINYIKQIAKKYNVKVGFPEQLCNPRILDKKIPLRNYSCNIFKGYNFAVYETGILSFCPFISLGEDFKIIGKSPIGIVNSQEYKKLREFFKKNGALPICRKCCALTKKN